MKRIALSGIPASLRRETALSASLRLSKKALSVLFDGLDVTDPVVSL